MIGTTDYRSEICYLNNDSVHCVYQDPDIDNFRK